MSRMHLFGEVMDWIQDWGINASSERAARVVANAAREQFDNVRWMPRGTPWCDREEYCLNVAILQVAAQEFAAVDAIVALCELARHDASEELARVAWEAGAERRAARGGFY